MTHNLKVFKRLLSSIPIKFLDKGKEKICQGTRGETLLALAKENNISLEGTCGGSQACSTCHVYIEKTFLKELTVMKEEEEDLLDEVDNYKENSRLACAIHLESNLKNMGVEVP
jgi:2Fe-2S ferredoxin